MNRTAPLHGLCLSKKDEISFFLRNDKADPFSIEKSGECHEVFLPTFLTLMGAVDFEEMMGMGKFLSSMSK